MSPQTFDEVEILRLVVPVGNDGRSVMANVRSAPFARSVRKSAVIQSGWRRPLHQQELSRIWDRIDRISTAVEASVPGQDELRMSRFPEDNRDAFDMLRGFPFMTVQDEEFMAFLGIDRTFSCHLVQVERSRDAVPLPTSPTSGLIISHEHAFHLLNNFAEHVHAWYPVLHGHFTVEFVHAIANGFPTSPESCLALLVLAIGRLFADGASPPQLENPYIGPAMQMLHCIVSGDGHLRATQCLLLFSIYFICCVEPCRAHDFVSMASYHLQDMLSIDCYWEKEQPNIIGNCYWAAVLVESEILVQLDLENSGSWRLSPIGLMPVSCGTWVVPLDLTTAQSPSSTVLANDGNGAWDELVLADLSYFVAEIAMRKMLRGCTLSARKGPGGGFEYAPVIAAELERQLEEWYSFLPRQFQFLGKALDASSLRGRSPQAQFLSAQYFAFRTSVYWPAVYQAFSTGKLDYALLSQCRRFFETYSAFIESAACAVYNCRPNLWTLCASVFTLSMAAIVTSRTPCLDSLVSSALLPCFQTAVRVFENVRHLSPSLAELGLILEGRVSWWLSFIR
ncbi:hypothetical protein AARAC_000849 [Aspergillus arachidicola]|uniref:Transcription factor domain-containing protein n=1 Tax=Aspergillus arachidicola TaxID=656916 RepID=A0A2G7G732_9EURO|nr:hypothetical protein AARAC_000849 [Aspergillus arachidicola]